MVDDDVSVRNAIDVIFEDREEFKIDQASSGYEAGLKLGRMNPDVIVLDIMLSDMDARNLVKKIRADKTFKHSKILGISAYFKDADVEKLKKLGFDDFLPKPFTANELEKKIEVLLESQ
ncbi:MAG: response regulator [Planctomycetota bacterium]|nr:response regulator [Planctomycetota bacterium]